MSEDGHREPGAIANGAPRNNAEQDDSPYRDYGPSLFATIQASASAVAGAVVGRPRVRTVPRGRAGVQKDKEEDMEKMGSQRMEDHSPRHAGRSW